MQEDARGLPLTAASAEAAEAYRGAIADYFDYRLSAMAKLKAALEADPGFFMAHILKGCFLSLVGTGRLAGKVAEAIADAEASSGGATARELGHLAALKAWHAGNYHGMNRVLEQVFQEHPKDAVALRLHHFNAFWMGDQMALLRGPASVFGAWSESDPGYPALLSMLSFGLEEAGERAAAERFGRDCVARNPDDLWGIHAVAHVLEMDERYEEGLSWLDYPFGTWDDRNPFKDHVWWHRALFALESGKDEAVHELYDREVAPDENAFYLDVQNAVSLLARLEFLGVGVGERWDALADYSAARVGDHAIAFTDIHFVWALARGERGGELSAELASLEALSREKSDLGEVARAATLPVSQAIAAFFQGAPQRTLELLLPRRADFIQLGASHAQRDLLDQLAIMAAGAAGEESLRARLLSERRLLRPGSRLLKSLAA